MHTTGPWIVLADSPAAIRTIDGSNIAPEVCHLEDARLMAAAPDLLAACQSVLDEFPSLDSGRIESIKTICRAAIARATGKD